MSWWLAWSWISSKSPAWDVGLPIALCYSTVKQINRRKERNANKIKNISATHCSAEQKNTAGFTSPQLEIHISLPEDFKQPPSFSITNSPGHSAMMLYVHTIYLGIIGVQDLSPPPPKRPVIHLMDATILSHTSETKSTWSVTAHTPRSGLCFLWQSHVPVQCWIMSIMGLMLPDWKWHRQHSS